MQPGIHFVQLRVCQEDRDGEGALPTLDEMVHVGKTVHAGMKEGRNDYVVCVTYVKSTVVLDGRTA